MMKKYVILAALIGEIGGGQIHNRNKCLACRERGYEPIVLYSVWSDEILIDELKQFEGNLVEETTFSPMAFSKKDREKILAKMLRAIDYVDGDEVIVESQGVPTVLWGELLAEKCEGKHLACLLSEVNKRQRKIADFIDFKLERREYSGISANVVQKNLSWRNLKLEECPYLTALAWNAPEDVPLDAYDNIDVQSDATIGIYGRLNKAFAAAAVESATRLADKYPDKVIKVVLIGGAEPFVEKKRMATLMQKKNIVPVLTGYIYPTPQKIFQLLDVCVASSGSAWIAGREGVTIAVDYAGKAIGVLGYDAKSALVRDEKFDRKNLDEYLEWILFKDFKRTEKYELPKRPDPTVYENRVKAQFDFIANSEQRREYYDFSRMKTSSYEFAVSVAYKLLGAKGLANAKRVVRQLRTLFGF